MTDSKTPISIRWFPLVLVLAAVAALVFQGTSATAQQGPPNLEALNNRLVGLFEINGVVFTDADETTGRLVVGVTNRGLARSVEQRLGVLGVAPQLVDIVVSPPIHQLATLRDQVRPLAGGLQIRFSGFVCTLGFNAVLSGVQGFVTNSHCTDTQGGVEGTLYYQPLNQTDGEFVGTETKDPNYSGNNCNGQIFPVRNRVCRWSDSAFVTRDSDADADLGYIEKTTGANNSSLTIDGRFQITDETTLAVGDTANKVGRTTGWTQAPVTRTCVHTGVSGTNIIQLCQTFIEDSNLLLVGGGDSGSPVFEIVSGDDVELAGILWGGSTDGTLIVFSPLANIEMSSTELGPLDTVATGDIDPAPGNTAPTANPVSAGTNEDMPVAITLSGSDAEDCDLMFSIVSGPSNGTLGSITNQACTGSGPYTDSASVTYTPAADFHGSDSFTYRVNDGSVDSESATVSVDVTPVNDAPVADAGPDQNVTTGSSVDLDGTDSSDVDGDTLTFSWQFSSTPASSSATLNDVNTASPSFTADVDGDYVVELTVSDGEIEDTDTVTVSASAASSSTDVHVGDLDANSTSQGSTWTALVTITSHDGDHSPVSNATVNGNWSGGASGPVSCVTNGNGQCTVSVGNIHKRNGSTTFTVGGVTHGTLTYDSAGNHDPDGDSNGTSVTVSKP